MDPNYFNNEERLPKRRRVDQTYWTPEQPSQPFQSFSTFDSWSAQGTSLTDHTNRLEPSSSFHASSRSFSSEVVMPVTSSAPNGYNPCGYYHSRRNLEAATNFQQYSAPPIPPVPVQDSSMIAQPFRPSSHFPQSWDCHPASYDHVLIEARQQPTEKIQTRPHQASLSHIMGETEETKPAEDDPIETVCFGTIIGVPTRCKAKTLENVPEEFDVELGDSGSFTAKHDPSIRGRVQPSYSQMVNGIFKEESITTYVSCSPDPDRSPSRKQLLGESYWDCTMTITIYGPYDLLGDIESYFEDYDTYLQDPRTVHENSRYCNPHRLSYNPERHITVQEICAMHSKNVVIHNATAGSDFLDQLDCHFDLEETLTPRLIRTSLKKYQKQALTFMIRREKGWNLEEGHSDLWRTFDNGQDILFVNTVSDTGHKDPPPQFRGGIIADPMGLGKTLTMIAMVANDKCDEDEVMQEATESRTRSTSATLIVVPPPLLGTWEEQLAQHVVKNGLTCRRHHGKSKLMTSSDLDGIDVVLTTYHTISADWRAKPPGTLFSTQWKRVVLDEAHLIRNAKSRMARALCAIEADARWAVTGTPIQNRLGDLSTLLHFIRAHPYSDPKIFEADISQVWRAGEDQKAIKRLKLLSSFLLLRRPKTAIDLPPRTDLTFEIELSPAERKAYETLRQQAVTKLEEAISGHSNVSEALAYVNVLQRIESMRLFCDLGLQYHSRHDTSSSESVVNRPWATVAQKTFDLQRDMGPITCTQCSITVEAGETIFEGTNNLEQNARFTSCFKFTCGECIFKMSSRRNISCGHIPPCQAAEVSTKTGMLEDQGNIEAPVMRYETNSLKLSSKVKVLVKDLKTVPPGEKCIVFSSWRLSLDMVEAGLKASSLKSVRFDGKVPQKQRQSIVESFNEDPSIRVMLLTLACGAVGLTLTSASRAYLLEPHWNPTVEEQALARIHRLGQTKPVTTVRLYVRESFEEQVMKVQEDKKNLAGTILSSNDGKSGSHSSLDALERLRRLL